MPKFLGQERLTKAPTPRDPLRNHTPRASARLPRRTAEPLIIMGGGGKKIP